MTKLYLVRHGETDYNKQGCYYGWTDCSLNERGIKQSEALKEVFKQIAYDAILSSDLKRAVETASIINGASARLIADRRLRELNFGQWEGKSSTELMSEYPEQWELWTSDWKNTAPMEGESLIDMQSRINEFVDDALVKYENKSIVIISHNGALRLIATHLLGLSLDKLWCFSFEHGKHSLLEVHNGHCVIRGINI